MKFTLILILAIFCTSSWAQRFPINEAIYGDDDRIFIEDSDIPQAVALAKGTAALFPTSALTKEFGGLLLQLIEKILVAA